jgi:two-component sensor histidine kinase
MARSCISGRDGPERPEAAALPTVLMTPVGLAGAAHVQGHSVRRLQLRWEEEGGPPVDLPASRGFGTTLLEHAAAGELGGKAELTFAPEGLEAEITVRLG